ncbi:MAG: polyketide cyclase, partial [Actinomycetia bacterium]|nr:polyketide cyclase [Actinomycetes bacterium]
PGRATTRQRWVVAQPFLFDRTWAFDVHVEELWAVVSDTSRFPEWWPWLEADGLGPLEPGTVAQFKVDPPLPYKLELTVAVQRVEPSALVEAMVSGDLAGPARMEVAADGDGSTARLAWSLEVQRRLLVVGEKVARPAMVWGHNTVVAKGLERFSAVLGATPRPR